MKLEKGLKELLSTQKIVKANIVVSKSIDSDLVTKTLKRMGVKDGSRLFKETNDKYMVTINQEQLKQLSETPWIIQIELGGMR